MVIEHVGPWTRLMDKPGQPLIPAARILYPKSLEELIDICANRTPTEYFKAGGSHWALSEAAISDGIFIETHDPNNQYAAMGRTLYDVVPGCLTQKFVGKLASEFPRQFEAPDIDPNEGTYLVHIETGKRIYQLYSELDLGDDANDESLARLIQDQYGNSSYMGPWALPTLGA